MSWKTQKDGENVRLKEAKETWQLNVIPNPRLDLELKKKKKSAIRGMTSSGDKVEK